MIGSQDVSSCSYAQLGGVLQYRPSQLQAIQAQHNMQQQQLLQNQMDWSQQMQQMGTQHSGLHAQQVVYAPNHDSFELRTLQKQEAKRGIMKSFREYLNQHRDMIFTVALVFICDHYLLGGALKERLKSLLEGILNKAETKFHKEISS